jgi:hypothetical protein
MIANSEKAYEYKESGTARVGGLRVDNMSLKERPAFQFSNIAIFRLISRNFKASFLRDKTSLRFLSI